GVAGAPGRKPKAPKVKSTEKNPKTTVASGGKGAVPPLANGADFKNFKCKKINWGALVTIAKACAEKTTRARFTSKAYDITKRRATLAAVPKETITTVGRQAYKDAAAAWDAVK
ncbi:unnamed protein product, partial [Prorocentrum cordatum]